MYRDFLVNIVEAELSRLQARIVTSLAVSLRVDSLVDRTQLDNKHCLVKIVDKNGEELFFLVSPGHKTEERLDTLKLLKRLARKL